MNKNNVRDYSSKEYTSNSTEKKRTDKRIIGPELGFVSKEAYNLLRTNLLFCFPEKEGCKVVGITSSCPQEGKSTISVNTAYSLAAAGNNVLLIDGDLRRPMVAKELNLSNATGLSNILVGTKNVELHKKVLDTSLWVLTSGPTPPNPSELLGSPNMKEVIDTFSKAFDYIIFDLPPVNSVSDPIVISQFLDGILIVVRHEFSKKSDINEAVSKLKFSNTRILGFLYNCYSKEGKGYYYKYRYKSNYYTRHYYDSKKKTNVSDTQQNN